MKLKDRVTIISEKNMNGLYQLYGEVSANEL